MVDQKSKYKHGTREMTQWLGTLATLSEDQSLIPNTHI